MLYELPRAKRRFDVSCICLGIVFCVPVLALCALAILISDGRPVFYKSSRRVLRKMTISVYKFRTMRRNAEKIANRNTVPLTTCFLNIPIDSPLYTPVGRLIERFMITEIPQLIHVLRGHMSLVGNRPLPENVIAALVVEYPDAEARFDVPTGLTGVAQLVGREFISDSDRLRIEIAYCKCVLTRYSILLDAKILFFTVMLAFSSRARFTINQVVAMLEKQSCGAAALPVRSAPLEDSKGLMPT